MKLGKYTYLIIGLIAGIIIGSFASDLYSKRSDVTLNTSTAANGAPSGSHYNLNVIGVPKGKTADMTGSMGHRIFVPLLGNCKINLSMGDFQVMDGNCTDGKSQFQLPNPDPMNSGVTTYSVWARALGKPGGSSETTTCATDPTDGLTYCSLYTMVQSRGTGKSTFGDVSKQLLYVYADIDGDGIVDRMPLFDERLQDYYWNYDNNGLRLMQLRFYPVASNVN
jgi:hypothetical protein